MLFKETEAFAGVINQCTEEVFLEKVCRKHHYLQEDMEQLRQIAVKMQKVIREKAFWQHDFREKQEKLSDTVVISLSEGIDELQEIYTAAGEYTAEYMVESLSAEILLMSYKAYNQYMLEHTPYHVARYCFPGSEESCPISLLPSLLQRLSAPVSCNAGYCMLPRKTVVFLAMLTGDKNVQCRGICMDCRRSDCPNRVKKEQPLPYGYARILGKEFL